MLPTYPQDDRPYIEKLFNPDIIPLEEQLTIIDNLEDLSTDKDRGDN